MTPKGKAVATTGAMPGHASQRNRSERMRIARALAQAEAEIERGEFLTHEEATKRIESFLERLGQRKTSKSNRRKR